MSGLVYVEGLGRASSCAVSKTHRAPAVLRFVWHHIQPQAAGGTTTPANLVALCDSCHMAVHVVLWLLARNGGVLPTPEGLPRQRTYADQGYTACITAGTVDRIPDEGGGSPS